MWHTPCSYFFYALHYKHWWTWEDKRSKAQGFYIEKEFECLCLVILGDGRVSSSTGLFLVAACFASQCFPNWAWCFAIDDVSKIEHKWRFVKKWVQCLAISDISTIEHEWWSFVKNWVWCFRNLVSNFSA